MGGFPTETEAAFARSLDLVGECGLTHLHVFPVLAAAGDAGGARAAGRRRTRQGPRPAAARARRGALQNRVDAEVGATRRVLTQEVAVGWAGAAQFTKVRLARAESPGQIVELKIAAHEMTILGS